jgi:hypothetical protein
VLTPRLSRAKVSSLLSANLVVILNSAVVKSINVRNIKRICVVHMYVHMMH